MSLVRNTVRTIILLWYVILQDSEYIKLAGDAWEEAVEIAKSKDGWKEERSDKKTVSIILLPY